MTESKTSKHSNVKTFPLIFLENDFHSNDSLVNFQTALKITKSKLNISTVSVLCKVNKKMEQKKMQPKCNPCVSMPRHFSFGNNKLKDVSNANMYKKARFRKNTTFDYLVSGS